ncbi:TMEM175 family protein [Microbacterium aquimaris]|uniref:TMEM175 family protein n=1 Tax=Microbacterium aquimaris TaxID=459816 RepID=A0ABU5N4A5_9MICO|nr:TMEM175 family protein [Microbacterium aquimaris]MDZ8160722.1 TMEM175 family protein [Microbacterium aquimaris]
MEEAARTRDDTQPLPSAERLKAFTDAVVAIAMTLLILPLMESVSDAGTGKAPVAEWFVEEWPALVAFALSFVLIANFWLVHHRLFAKVERVDTPLLWLTVLWMFTIVWMPVATAITTAFAEDTIQLVVYIGTLTVTSAVLSLTRLYLARHPGLHDEPPGAMRDEIVGGWIVTGLFVVALIVSIVVPVVSYAALLLLALRPVVQKVVLRIRA